MKVIISFLSDYLTNHAALTLFLCLGLGFIIGKIKFKSFSLGSTVGTLLIGLVINQFINFQDSAILKSVMFSLFCFTLGFDVGPAFVSGFRSSGLKIIILSVFFCAVSVVGGCIVFKMFGIDAPTGLGILAGALTQTSISGIANFGSGLDDAKILAFGLTYIFGTLGVIIFINNIAPVLLRKSLSAITKEKIDKISDSNNKGQVLPNNILQMRAYLVEKDSKYCNLSVKEFEEKYDNRIEIEAVYRGDVELVDIQNLKILAGDVIAIIGDIAAINVADDFGLRETTDPKYYQVKVTEAKIVLTDDFEENGASLLSELGILVKNTNKKTSFKKHSIISVTGPAKAIKKAAGKLGYIKEEGNLTDTTFMTLAIAGGLLLGSLSICLNGFPLSLGDSVGVLFSGLFCGWLYNKRPRVGHIPQAIHLFLKSLGLNFYIAMLALTLNCNLADVLKDNGVLILAVGVIITILPHLASLFFGKYVLKIDDADLLGGLCGCGTCTAALNALTDETKSSVFAIGYAPGCAAGNILLTLSGLVFLAIM